VPAVSHEVLAALYDDRYAGSYMEAPDAIEVGRVGDVLAATAGDPREVLDYGCGRGAWMPALREWLPGARVCGTDISVVALRHAAERLPDADFRVMSEGRAPFAPASFDLVFSYHVLEHVGDLTATIADMCFLVRPGGRLFAALPCGNHGSLERRIAALSRGGVEPAPGGWRLAFEDEAHLRRLTTEELVAALRPHGFELETAAYGNHLWGAVQWICRGGPQTVDEVLRPGLGRSAASRCALHAGRAVLRSVARAYGRPRRRSLADAVDRLAAREWRVRRADPAASAQYLVFRRRPAPRACAG
jgi:SAM-dependent methyltransferase